MSTPPPPPRPLVTATGLYDPRAEVTLTEAAELFAVSYDTVKMRLRHGKFSRAVKKRIIGDEIERWYVPIADLVDAGIAPAARVQPASTFTTADADAGDAALLVEIAVLRTKVEMLEQEVAFWRSQRPGSPGVGAMAVAS